jgi:hypothetical protein
MRDGFAGASAGLFASSRRCLLDRATSIFILRSHMSNVLVVGDVFAMSYLSQNSSVPKETTMMGFLYFHHKHIVPSRT